MPDPFDAPHYSPCENPMDESQAAPFLSGPAEGLRAHSEKIRPKCLPTVLIISSNPLSTTQNNGKTYQSLFVGWPKEKLSQIYVKGDMPSRDVCDRYFRMTLKDVLLQRLRLRDRPVPKPLRCSEGNPRSSTYATLLSLLQTRVIKSQTLRLAYSVLFDECIPRAYESLYGWLEERPPEVIFLSAGDLPHLYRLANIISLRHNARCIVYLTDDYILPIASLNPSRQALRAWVRRRLMRTLARDGSELATIGKEMSATYRENFALSSRSFMNVSDVHAQRYENDSNGVLRLAYIGGLHTNRWRTLARLVDAIEQAQLTGLRIELKVFSGRAPSSHVYAQLHRPPYSTFCGSLDSSGVEREMAQADVLVHVESFRKSDIWVTRMSISTKIADYLRAGKCILAVGPPTIASVQYLQSVNAGPVVTTSSLQALGAAIADLATSARSVEQFGLQASVAGFQNHDPNVVREQFRRLLTGID